MDKKVIRYESMVQNEGKLNSQFSKAKIFIAYSGYNRNMTHIDKPVFEKMIPSLFNIPVVGEWKEEVDNFGGHGGKLEISEKGIKHIETTKPYGLIPESSEVKWELVRDKDNVEREYLTATAYLWTGRYPELDKVLEDGSNQSMEISIFEGEKDDSDGYYYIHKAEFSALCILGKDEENIDNNVEPCFEGASVTSEFNFSDDDDKVFKNEFSLMKQELDGALTEHKSMKGEVEFMAKTETIKDEVVVETVKAELEQPLEVEVAVEEIVTETEFEADEKVEDKVDEVVTEATDEFVAEDKKDEDEEDEVDKKEKKDDKKEIDKTKASLENPEINEDVKVEVDYEARVLELETKLQAFEDANYLNTISTLEAQLQAYKTAEDNAIKAQHSAQVTELVDSYGVELDEENIASFTKLGETLTIEELEDKIDAYMYKQVKATKTGIKKYKLQSNTAVIITPVITAEISKYGKYSVK